MKNLVKNLFPVILFLAGATLFNACIEEDFDQPPTDGTDPGLTANMTIKDLKAKHVFNQLETLDEDIIIKGIVVADDASGNLYRTFVLQDETGGIQVTVNTADSYVYYPIGREIFIKCKGLILSDYRKLIQLGGYITETGSLGPIIDVTGHIIKGVKKGAPAPKVKKITELTSADVSTLITLENVQFVKADTSKTFADPVTRTDYNRYLEDCDFQSVIVRTSGYASFAGTKLPKGGGTFTGVLSIYNNDLQFLIRSMDDLNMSGPRCVFNPCAGTVITEVSSLNVNFTGGTDNQDVNLTGWSNVAVKGSRLWRFRIFSGNTYVQATAYNDTNPDMEAWLVTPGIKLDVPKVLSFESAQAFWTHNALSVWISKDYVCDPTIATWQPLTPPVLAGQSNTNYAFVPSGDIDLSGYTGTVFIGFKYVGKNSAGQTCTYQLDNILVKNK